MTLSVNLLELGKLKRILKIKPHQLYLAMGCKTNRGGLKLYALSQIY